MEYDNEEYNPRLKALILEVVDNQIRDNDPPITRKTLERLVSSEYSKQQAKEKIGGVIAEHIFISCMTTRNSMRKNTKRNSEN